MPVIADDLIKLEQAAFSAWPALESQLLVPWVLRFAEGYTKRANSANAIQVVKQLNDQQLEAIEAFFYARQQPPIFRLASFLAAESVDNKLIERGYRFNDLTLVMSTAVSHSMGTPAVSVEFLDIAPWLEHFQPISGKIGSSQAIHLRMLQAIAQPAAFAVIRQEGQTVCCGLAVVTDECVGLFDIATAAAFRQRGLASQLCRALMSWGAEQGARTAYLQVVAANHPALNLYEGLGFRKAYHYWYRVGRKNTGQSTS